MNLDFDHMTLAGKYRGHTIEQDEDGLWCVSKGRVAVGFAYSETGARALVDEVES
jgi:hypothetical protein